MLLRSLPWWIEVLFPTALLVGVAFPGGNEYGPTKFEGDIGLATDPIAAGHLIKLEIDHSGYTPRRMSVRVELIAPCRLRIAPRSVFAINLDGTPRVKCEAAPRNLRLWCDDDALPQQIFADRVLADRLQMTIRSRGDILDLRPDSLRVKVVTSRYESDLAAMHAAWRAAATIIERLRLGKLGLMHLH